MFNWGNSGRSSTVSRSESAAAAAAARRSLHGEAPSVAQSVVLSVAVTSVAVTRNSSLASSAQTDRPTSVVAIPTIQAIQAPAEKEVDKDDDNAHDKHDNNDLDDDLESQHIPKNPETGRFMIQAETKEVPNEINVSKFRSMSTTDMDDESLMGAVSAAAEPPSPSIHKKQPTTATTTTTTTTPTTPTTTPPPPPPPSTIFMSPAATSTTAHSLGNIQEEDKLYLSEPTLSPEDLPPIPTKSIPPTVPTVHEDTAAPTAPIPPVVATAVPKQPPVVATPAPISPVVATPAAIPPVVATPASIPPVVATAAPKKTATEAPASIPPVVATAVPKKTQPVAAPAAIPPVVATPAPKKAAPSPKPAPRSSAAKMAAPAAIAAGSVASTSVLSIAVAPAAVAAAAPAVLAPAAVAGSAALVAAPKQQTKTPDIETGHVDKPTNDLAEQAQPKKTDADAFHGGAHHHHHHHHSYPESYHDEEDDSSSSSGSSSSESSEESEEEVPSSKFPDGSFSFIITAPFTSAPFITAFGVFSLEMIIFALITVNLVTGPTHNPLNLPASVSGAVILSQFFALLIAVTSQDDVISAFNLIYEGYHKETMERIYSDITCFKWFMAIIMMLISGTFGLAVTFMLIVTSDNVVSLLLNFTAVEFVSLLDNAAFLLSQQGFLGSANKEQADEIGETAHEVPIQRKGGRCMQILMLLGSYIILLSSWGYIYNQQIRGVYTPGVIVVQFDDEVSLKLGTYSGLYRLRINQRSFGFDRIRYIGVNDRGMFAYCESDGVWAFSEVVSKDDCNYIARSSSSSSFDITTTASSDWFVTDDLALQRFFPMNNFELALGCNLDVDCGGLNVAGNPRGRCERNECLCHPPYYGWRCEYTRAETCGIVEADTISPLSGFQGNQEYSDRYDILRNKRGSIVQVYARPIYLSNINREGQGNVILYTGLRWGLFSLPPNLEKGINLTTVLELADYFSHPFRFNVDRFLATSEFFVSQTVSINTPEDMSTPVGLTWTQVDRSNNVLTMTSSDATLLCAVCNNDTNPCSFDNLCPASGECQCNNGATDLLCRVAPTANGFCNNDFFNNNDFSYDGGDCCEATCKSAPNNTCGFTYLNGTMNLLNIQYPNCVDPSVLTCSESSNQCWVPRSQQLPLPSGSVGVKVIVSSNGRVLVLSDPELETVRVFDQLDSSWVQRGSTIDDVRESQLGVHAGLFTPPANAHSVGTSGVNTLLVLGLYRLDLPGMRIVSFDTVTNRWNDVANEISLCQSSCTLTGVAIGSQGQNVVASGGIDETSVAIYTSSLIGSTQWTLAQVIQGADFSLSGDGSTLAVVESINSTNIVIYSIEYSNPSSPTVERVRNGIIADNTNVWTVHALQMSFDGTELTVVMRHATLSDLVFRIDVTRPFLPTVPNVSIIGRVSRRALSSGFDPVSLSQDGTGLALAIDTPSGPVLQVYGFIDTLFSWMRVGVDYTGVPLDEVFGVSTQGRTLVTGTQSFLNVSTLYPYCPVNTTRYRLSIVLGDAPENVDWSLRSFQIESNNNTKVYGALDKMCDGCFGDVMNYASVVVNEDECVPVDQCLELTYRDNSSATPFYVFENEGLIWNSVGDTTNEMTVLGDTSLCTV